MRFYLKLSALVLIGFIALILMPAVHHEQQRYRVAEDEYEKASMAYANCAAEGHQPTPEVMTAKDRAEKVFVEASRRYRFYFAWWLRDPKLTHNQ
jgi:hypothetical protein